MFVVGKLVAAPCVCLAACAYNGGSFVGYGQEFAGVRATFGCVDASIARRADLATGPVISYEFGNGCDHPVHVDFALVEVSGRDNAGRELVLRPYDPDHEIHRALLDGRRYGEEAIQYVADSTPRAALATVCVDPAAAFGDERPRWSCFASTR